MSLVLTCVTASSVPSSSDSQGLGKWVRGDSGVASESWVWKESVEGLLMSSGVVWVDVPFMEPMAPYIASSGDAPFLVLLQVPCVVPSV